MIYSEDTEKSREVAEITIEQMEKIDVPPHPENYTVWYEHFSGRNPALSKVLDAMMTRKMRFTPGRSRDIFSRFLGAGTLDTQEAEFNSRLEAHAKRVSEALDSAGSETEKYGEALATFSGNLDGAESKSEIAELISEMAQDTASIEGELRNLKKEVEESRSEMETMRRQLEVTRHEAQTDRLTGIPNRRCFDETLGTLLEEAQEENSPLCLAIADIDHFKKFNDTFGHQVGDQVLKPVANTLTSGLKGRDIAVRFGGEEFALILPYTGLKGAATVAEQLREALAGRKLFRKDNTENMGSVNMSFGVTELILGETAETLIGRADALLYKAKQNGRNRVEASHSAPGMKKSA